MRSESLGLILLLWPTERTMSLCVQHDRSNLYYCPRNECYGSCRHFSLSCGSHQNGMWSQSDEEVAKSAVIDKTSRSTVVCTYGAIQ